MEKKLSFSLGYPSHDLIVSIFALCWSSSLLDGDYRGKDFYYAPLVSVLVYLISWIRHRKDFNRKDAEWEQHCKGYLGAN